MAGYLRQLAEQALGPTPALRSAAAAAYSPLPPLEEVGLATLPGFVSTDVPADGARIFVPQRMAQRDEGVVPSRPGAASSSDPSARRVPTQALPTSTAPAPVAPAAFPQQSAPRKPAPGFSEHLPSRRRASTLSSERAAAVDPPPKPNPGIPAPDAQKSLSPAPHRPQEVQPRQATQRNRTGGVAVPDIHIHIGRIELTAGGAQTPAKRAAAKGTGPMTLDAYLRQRGRRSP